MQRVSPRLTSLLEKAAKFHGHLGPFLVIGVRMGLIGLKGISGSKSKQMVVTASLPLRIPFSCIIDGLQFSTNCTVGNRKLSFEDSEKIQAVFERGDSKQKIIVALNESSLEMLKDQLLEETLRDEEVRRLAWKVAAIPEDVLFITT